MKIAFDNIIMNLQPDALTWEPPQVMARDGDYAPVRGQFFSCRLSFGKAVLPMLYDWQEVFNTSLHLATLPHPFNGVMTDFCCYVDSVTPRMDTSDQSDHCSVLVGLDITLSGISLAPIDTIYFPLYGWPGSFSLYGICPPLP